MRPLAKWIRRLKKGDQSAFLPLYEKTAPGLLRFLLWKTNGDRPLSEDILQEAFVRFLVNIDNLESQEDIGIQAYLLRIVKHCLIDKVARVPQTIKNQVQIESIDSLPEPNGVCRQEKAVELRELAIAMQSLNEKDSEIIWLRDAMGLSHREVANQVGITEQASRQAYVRAKRTLLSGLSERVLMTEGDVYAAAEMS
ncbi:MAG: sigma-70 family RNA polymerase sigma factor [Deltaproteobacteria bacterium]|nr:sigma-70 family RNA polymerase sigma factor [Deltaproteobacteria bacterium]